MSEALWLTTVDLDGPLTDFCVPPRGSPGGRYDGVRLLTRLHGQPMGELEMSVEAGKVPAERVASAARTQLADVLRAHLASDGLVAAADIDAPLAFELPDHAAPCRWSVRLSALGIGTPLVSVVLATYRRPQRLVRTLRTLLAQTYPSFEIVVADNCPQEPGVAAAIESLGDPRVRLVSEPRPGASAARNAALQAAQGRVVAVTDDDVDVDPDWLGALVTPLFEDASLGCVTGLILPTSMESRAERLLEEFGGYAKGYASRTFSLTDADHGPLYPYNVGIFGSGASSALPRQLLLELGGFSLNLGPATPARGGEDLDVFLSVLHAGYRLRYEPAAIVRHEHPHEMTQLTAQIYGYGVGLSAMMTKRMVASRTERRKILRAMPQACRYLLNGNSAKNARKTADYPRRLDFYELAGIAYGPIAYLRSRRRSTSGPAR